MNPSDVEWRVEAREIKARTELDSYRAVVDQLGFSPVLVNYAIECQLKEKGRLSFQLLVLCSVVTTKV